VCCGTLHDIPCWATVKECQQHCPDTRRAFKD
jgi:hypothetical protein